MAFGCGSNSFGQLGLGKQVKNVSEFTPLKITEKVIKVSAGMRHSLFLLEDGTIRACGSGKKGQLCDNEKVQKVIKWRNDTLIPEKGKKSVLKQEKLLFFKMTTSDLVFWSNIDCYSISYQ